MANYKRFSLKALLVLMTLLCVWAGVYSYRAQRQREVVDVIRKAGGRITYSFQEGPGIQPSALSRRIAATFGEEYAYTVSGVTFYPEKDRSADGLVHVLVHMPDLKRLAIWPEARGKKSLDNNAVSGLTDRGGEFIINTLPYLEHLSVTAAQISDSCVDRLLRQAKLKSLQVSRNPNYGSEHVTTSYLDSNGQVHTVDLRNGRSSGME